MEQSEIRDLLERIRALLERYGEKQWSKEIAYLEESFDRAYATTSDDRKREALDQISRLFGGMGSFVDFRFSRAGGHNVPPAEQPSANRELDQMTSQLYQSVLEERQKLGSTH